MSLQAKSYEIALAKRQASDARKRSQPRKPMKRTKMVVRGSKPLRSKPDSKLAAWSRKVRERDDYVCQITGVRDVQRNIAHHVAPRGRRPDLRLNVDNGITLTPEAHQWVHDHPIAATLKGWLSDATYEAAQKLEGMKK